MLGILHAGCAMTYVYAAAAACCAVYSVVAPSSMFRQYFLVCHFRLEITDVLHQKQQTGVTQNTRVAGDMRRSI